MQEPTPPGIFTSAAFDSVKADSIKSKQSRLRDISVPALECGAANIREFETQSASAVSVSAGFSLGVMSSGTSVSAGTVHAQTLATQSADFSSLTAGTSGSTSLVSGLGAFGDASVENLVVTNLSGQVATTVSSASSATSESLSVGGTVSIFGSDPVSQPVVYGPDMEDITAALISLGLLEMAPDPAGPFAYTAGPIGEYVDASEIRSVSISGDTVVVGCPFVLGQSFGITFHIGRVFMFTRVNGVWTKDDYEFAPSDTSRAPGDGMRFGASVCLDGDTLAVGAPYTADKAGWVFMYAKTDGVWAQQGSPLEDSVGEFGASVTLNGDRLVVGCPYTADTIGAATLFHRFGNSWSYLNQISPNETSGLRSYGTAVKMSTSGDTLLVSAEGDNNNVGAVFVFKLVEGVWVQDGDKLVGSGYVGPPVYQGYNVGINADGTVLAFGGSYDNNQAGAIWVFRRTGSGWVQDGGKLTTTLPVSYLGRSLDLSDAGNLIVAGAPNYVITFVYNGSVWTESFNYQTPEASSDFGGSLVISRDGNVFVATSYDNSPPFLGAYVFEK